MAKHVSIVRGHGTVNGTLTNGDTVGNTSGVVQAGGTALNPAVITGAIVNAVASTFEVNGVLTANQPVHERGHGDAHRRQRQLVHRLVDRQRRRQSGDDHQRRHTRRRVDHQQRQRHSHHHAHADHSHPEQQRHSEHQVPTQRLGRQRRSVQCHRRRPDRGRAFHLHQPDRRPGVGNFSFGGIGTGGSVTINGAQGKLTANTITQSGGTVTNTGGTLTGAGDTRSP